MLVKCPHCGNEQQYNGKGGKKAHTKCKNPNCKKDFYITETVPKAPKPYREYRKKNNVPKEEIRLLVQQVSSRYKNKSAPGIKLIIKKVENWLNSL